MDIERMISVNILTSFKTAGELKTHLENILNITEYGEDLGLIYVRKLCRSLIGLVSLEGHKCRVKSENYAVHIIGLELIKDVIPLFISVYEGGDVSVSYLCDEYSKEELFQVKMILDSYERTIKDIKESIEINTKNIENFAPSEIISAIFEGMSLSEIIAFTRDDLEDYIEVERGFDEGIAVRVSTIFDIVKDNKELVESIFITQEPVLNNVNVRLDDRLIGTNCQLLLMDRKRLNALLSV